MLQEGKIVLRQLEERDAPVLAALANNKNIWDHLRDYFPSPYTLDDAHQFIQHCRLEQKAMTFAIEQEGAFCGVIGLVAQTDVYQKSAEIGYWIGEPYWNKHIATVAVKLLTAHGFNALGFVRLYAGVFDYNEGSMRVLEKNGYQKEAVLKKAIYKNGALYDEHRYAKIT